MMEESPNPLDSMSRQHQQKALIEYAQELKAQGMHESAAELLKLLATL
jgi:uncharacterized protein YoaH (UPF0181 family)